MESQSTITEKPALQCLPASRKFTATTFTVRFMDAGVAHMAAFAEGMMLRDYSYDHYKMKDDENEDDSTKQIRLACSEKEVGELTSLVEKYRGIAKGVHLSRDLGTVLQTICILKNLLTERGNGLSNMTMSKSPSSTTIKH